MEIREKRQKGEKRKEKGERKAKEKRKITQREEREARLHVLLWWSQCLCGGEPEEKKKQEKPGPGAPRLHRHLAPVGNCKWSSSEVKEKT